jgi:hypothetical protein
MKKTFDCVAMKRRGAERIHEQTAGMTVEQNLTFWRQRTEALKQKQRAVWNRSERWSSQGISG